MHRSTAGLSDSTSKLHARASGESAVIATQRTLIAFSRYERTHPNLVSQAREIEILWTANWPPLYVFAGAVGLVFVYISAF